jgi:hypothetical protein
LECVGGSPQYPQLELTAAVSQAMDDGATGDRWVRMSRTIAEWIKDKRPVMAVDVMIG